MIYDGILDYAEPYLRKSLNHVMRDFPNLNIERIVRFWRNTTGFLLSILIGMLFIYTFSNYLPRKGLTQETIITILLCIIILTLINKK